MMASRTRIAYIAGVIVVAAILGIAAPAFATSLSGVNSHSVPLTVYGNTTSYPGTNGYQDHIGPGYLMFWTDNLTLAQHIPSAGTTVTGTVADGLVNGTTYHYNCYGPNIVQTEPASNGPPHLSGGDISYTTPPGPGYVLVVIDLAQYCQLAYVTNG
jgi:hypothetical protein